MPTLNIVKLDGGNAFGEAGRAMAPSNIPSEHISIMDQYQLNDETLSQYNVLIVTDFIDQEFLLEQKNVIENFLNEGKIVVACTHMFRPWLPNVNPFMPKEIRKHSDYEMMPTATPGFFAGVDMQELAYRKGVSGFYARGYHPAPVKDAEVMLTFLDGTPITYVDRSSTAGTIVAHSARDLTSYATGDNTTKLIASQFKTWLGEELARLEEAK
ncbi:MAG: phosphate starvation-inducible protein PhoH [Lysinibacillus sp.]